MNEEEMAMEAEEGTTEETADETAEEEEVAQDWYSTSAVTLEHLRESARRSEAFTTAVAAAAQAEIDRLDGTIGDINALLDALNGEVV